MIYIVVLLACVAGALGAALVASRSALRTARQSAEAYSAEVQRLGGENATLTATLARITSTTSNSTSVMPFFSPPLILFNSSTIQLFNFTSTPYRN